MRPVAHLPPAHILVVDDDPAVREALAAGLDDRYEVATAATGAEACAALQQHPISAIILDAILENEHGLDLVPRFRALAPVPIQILTGHSSEELAIRAIAVGVAGYLKKPVNLHDLRSAVDRLISPVPADTAERARRWLDDHATKPCRIAELAGHLGLTESNLRRLFRSVYGKTPHRYLTDIRLVHARTLLETTPWDVKQVAGESGFGNLAVFRRLFRKAFGCPPTAFRLRRPSGSFDRPGL